MPRIIVINNEDLNLYRPRHGIEPLAVIASITRYLAYHKLLFLSAMFAAVFFLGILP